MSIIEKINSATCTLRLQKDWLKIFTCPVPSSDFLSFVGIATIDAPQHEGRVVYQLVSAPWPVSDREIITRSQGYLDPDTSEVYIKLECMPDYLPLNDKYVRVPQLEGAWNIIPLSQDQCRVVFRLHIEPGGEIPSWLANIAVIDTPYHTLTNLREMVKQEKYLVPVEAPFKKSAKDVIQNYENFITE